MRLVHTGNHKLTSRQFMWLAWSLPIVVGKTYVHHIGKLPKWQTGAKATFLYIDIVKSHKPATGPSNENAT